MIERLVREQWRAARQAAGIFQTNRDTSHFTPDAAA